MGLFSRVAVRIIAPVVAAAGLATLVFAGGAFADGQGVHNYTAHFWGVDGQGYTSIDGAVDSATTCGVPVGAPATGQINFTMKGHWPAAGPFFMHSVTMTNNTNDWFHLYDIGFFYDNENYHFPNSHVELEAHHSFTWTPDYTGHHAWSTMVFNSILGASSRCGGAGNSAWKIVP